MAKQRQVRIEQSLPQNLMEAMQERSDEQLEAETKHRSIALAMLGARAAERYDAPAARLYFRRAIAAARPQERMQIRRMADASLALAERRPDDLKQAVERLGHEAPSGRALFGLRLMGLVAPPPGSSILLRVRGFLIVATIVIAAVALGFGVVNLIALLFGGVGFAPGLLLGIILVGVVLAVLAFLGRRRQAAARAAGKTAIPPRKPASSSSKASSPAKTSSHAKATAANANGSGQARRGSDRATGSAKAATPAKPASPKRGEAAKQRPARPARPRRPSR